MKWCDSKMSWNDSKTKAGACQIMAVSPLTLDFAMLHRGNVIYTQLRNHFPPMVYEIISE